MNKRISTALLASGLVLGGIGTAQLAGAQYGDAEPAPAEASADQGTVLEIQEETETPENGERDGRRGQGCGHGLETAAETIGIEEDALRAALDDGQTIAEVAESNGVDPQTVIDAMVAAGEERLDDKVEDGRLTAEEADERLAEKADRIEDRVFGVEVDAAA